MQIIDSTFVLNSHTHTLLPKAFLSDYDLKNSFNLLLYKAGLFSTSDTNVSESITPVNSISSSDIVWDTARVFESAVVVKCTTKKYLVRVGP